MYCYNNCIFTNCSDVWVNPTSLSSQHSCVNSAADHRAHLHLSLPSIMSLIAAVRLESDHGWERETEPVIVLLVHPIESLYRTLCRLVLTTCTPVHEEQQAFGMLKTCLRGEPYLCD